jgi:Cell division GTPase
MSVVDKNTTVVEAFKLADSVLHHASKGISDLINVHGLVNLDFADVETIMKNMGEAVIGTGTAKGEERAVLAAQQAISSPLLDNASISGAQGVLVNITGGSDLAIMEVDQATNIIFEEAGQGANIIFGAVIDPDLKDEIMVTVIATGFNHKIAEDDISNRAIESHLESKQQYKTVTEQENVPLHKQENQEEYISEQLPIENSEPKKLFDDLNPVMKENDLDVPAFIRRQQD